jgi:hypothetical protein
VPAPPSGIGVYARGHIPAPGPWAWYAGREWAFVGVEAMDPAQPGGMGAVLAHCERGARAGKVILDPERPYTAAQVDALATWVRAAVSRGVQVGITSFPTWGGLRRLARALRGLVWASPQLYYDARTNARAWRVWAALFGESALVPSVAAYVAGPITKPDVAALRSNAAGYAVHLSSIPKAGGVIVWPVWPVPAYMTEAIARRWG